MRANSSLVRTAKDGSTGLAGSGAGLSPWRRQGGAAWSTSTSTSLRADGTVRTHTVTVFGGRLGGGGVAAREQADCVFPHPTTGASISLRSVVEGLRDAGLDVGDEDAVDSLVEGLGRFAPQQVEEGSRGRSSDADLRCGWLGVDRARFPWHAGERGFDADVFAGGAAYPEDQVNERAAEDGTGYGYCDDVLADIAELRGSYFREGLSLDLTWNHLFLDEMIPVPATILEWMREDGYARLHRLWRMVLVTAMTRTKLCPTVFIRGGGEGLNPDTHADADTVQNPTTGEGLPSIRYGAVKDGRTAHHASAVIPSALGWDPWYWDEAEIGFSAPSSTWVSTDDGTFTLANQRVALNVYNGDEADPTIPASVGTYLGRVALRKSLALAAFGRALGEGLGILDSVLTGLGYRLDHVIPHLEFGAEMDAQWAFTGVTAASATDYPSEPLFAESAREYARFHAVLAATIRVGWPGARFKTTELASAANDTQWELRTTWLGDALAVQLDREAQFLNSVATVYRFARDMPDLDLSTLGGTYPAAVDWYQEALAAGLDLPPTDGRVTPSMLVQVTGIHYFRYWGADEDEDMPIGYLNESEMNDSILTPLLTYVLAPCRTAGIPLQWGAGNVGFPSGVTYADGQGHALPSVYPGGNSQELQAGHLVRLLLTLIGYGASHVLWYAHMEAKETTGSSAAAGIFATMGLRNDVPEPSAPDASTGAWPKASWWAYQRLATLLARADRVDIVYNAAGFVVVRIVGGRNGLVSPNGSRAWRYGYVAWLDSASPDAAQTATIELDRLPEPDVVDWFERVALVPAATSWATDSSPYAESTAPDWDDADPWNPAHFAHCSLPFVNLGEHTVFDASWHPQTVGRVGITLSPTTQANFGIVCWLTDSAALTVTRVA